MNISPFTIYYNLASSIILYIIDFIYIIDLITGFFRAYFNFEEIMVQRNVDIFINYLTGWFILDFIEAIPFFTLLDHQMIKLRDKFLVNSDGDSEHIFNFGINNKYFSLTFIKIIKIFKTFSNNSALTEIKKFLDNIQFFYEWKGMFNSLLMI